MEKITALVTAISGEEKYLSNCLSSAGGFAHEIVIIDMSGGSEISSIAKKYKAKIYKHEFVNYVEPVRNFGISKVTGDWILILDPDEEIGSGLKDKLNEIIKSNSADYIRIPRKNIVFGKWLQHSRWFPDYNIRFFKKGHVVWSEIIHGVPTTEGRGMDLEADKKYAIKHNHYSSIEEYLLRLNRYTSVQASMKAKDYKFFWPDLIHKPVGEFLSRFFAGNGYKDGVHGLALSLLQAFSELVLYLKIWEIQKFEKQKLTLKEVVSEIEKSQSEINFWKANALVEKYGGVVNRIKRKFKLQ